VRKDRGLFAHGVVALFPATSREDTVEVGPVCRSRGRGHGAAPLASAK